MNLQSTDFELFQLPVQFAQSRAVVDARWKELQREAHPDKFAAQGAAAQRLAMQWSVRINEAYQRLKDPLKRASYLCELHCERIVAENNTAMPSAFLIQQMEWREALEEIDSVEALEDLLDEVAAEKKRCLALIAQQIDSEKNAQAANATAQALLFIDKFMIELTKKLEQLEDAS